MCDVVSVVSLLAVILVPTDALLTDPRIIRGGTGTQVVCWSLGSEHGVCHHGWSLL
jgi:hypothetical protein